MELLEFEGENLDSTTLTMINGTSEELSEYNRNGYYLTMLVFKGNTTEDSIKITKFKIKLNDNIIEINLKNPIKHSTNNWELCDKDAYIYGIGPLAYFSWGIYTPIFDDVLSTYNYTYDIKEDIELIDIFITHSMEIIDSRILLDDEAIGSISDVLPIEIDKGSKMRLDVTFWFTDDIINYKSCEINSNLVLLYKTKEGIEKKYYFMLNVMGLTNIEDVNILIDQCVQDISKYTI